MAHDGPESRFAPRVFCGRRKWHWTEFAAAAKEDWGRSAILQYDLRSGKLLHRIEGPPKAALGDMALAANGDPIVSDGEHGGVYRVNRNTQGFERIDAGDFVSPQTPAALPDGTHLLVPDYVRGLGMLDLNTRQVDWFPDGRQACPERHRRTLCARKHPDRDAERDLAGKGGAIRFDMRPKPACCPSPSSSAQLRRSAIPRMESWSAVTFTTSPIQAGTFSTSTAICSKAKACP